MPYQRKPPGAKRVSGSTGALRRDAVYPRAVRLDDVVQQELQEATCLRLALAEVRKDSLVALEKYDLRETDSYRDLVFGFFTKRILRVYGLNGLNGVAGKEAAPQDMEPF